jgi:alpha-1,3-rhamnosyl/mannosyltransferase
VRIAVDATHSINDHRAIRRYARELVRELGAAPSRLGVELCFLYFFARRSVLAEIQPPLNARYSHRVSCRSARYLVPIMRMLGWPRAEHYARAPLNLLHFPGGDPYLPTRAPFVVSTVHGFAHVHAAAALPAGVIRVLERKCANCLRLSTHFITVSETSKSELAQLYGIHPSRIAAIPLGVSAEFSAGALDGPRRRELRERYGFAAERVALYTGALEAHKNVRAVVAAFERVQARERGRWQLALVGPRGDYAEKLRELAAEHCSGGVRFVHDLLPGSRALADLYRLSDVFVFPSYYESWASPPLEAMISGVPAIVSDIPSLRESTGGAAVYVQPDDVDSLSECMLRVVGDCALRERQRRAGLEFASAQTWQRCAERTLRYYLQLLGAGDFAPAHETAAPNTAITA